MTTDGSPFGEGLEEKFQDAPKAEAMASGRIPPGVYKAVCTAVDVKGDGNVVDHELIPSSTGNNGVKIFFEILWPEKVKVKGSEKEFVVKGEIQEHVFWVTELTLPHIKRDAAIILGRELSSLNEMLENIWAGKTCEVVIREEVYGGYVNSRVKFINPWKPKVTAEEAAPF